MEGEWDEVMGLIRKCRDTMHRHHDRISWFIKIEDWKGKRGRLRGMVASVEKALGEEVAK